MRTHFAIPIVPAPWFWISAGVHSVIFLLGGSLLVETAKFGVQQGLSSLEVNLVAAPAATRMESTVSQQEELPAAPRLQLPTATDDLTQSVSELLKQPSYATPLPKPAATSAASHRINEAGISEEVGSGHNKMTASSGGGARTVAKPDYQSNPPPVYPEMARSQNQHGDVLVRVEVTAAGRAAEVQVESSSGYRLLDESAMRAVRNWKFLPGKIGGQAVDSVVIVPIRFNLEDAR